jgi:hypothetical protein
MAIVCSTYGVSADGAKHSIISSYNVNSSIAKPDRGRAIAFCPLNSDSWQYPQLEFDIGLIPEPNPGDLFSVANAVATTTCRYTLAK